MRFDRRCPRLLLTPGMERASRRPQTTDPDAATEALVGVAVGGDNGRVCGQFSPRAERRPAVPDARGHRDRDAPDRLWRGPAGRPRHLERHDSRDRCRRRLERRSGGSNTGSSGNSSSSGGSSGSGSSSSHSISGPAPATAGSAASRSEPGRHQLDLRRRLTRGPASGGHAARGAAIDERGLPAPLP